MGELLSLSNIKPVVYNVVMGKHHPFGIAGSAGGILHIYHVMGIHRGFDFLIFVIFYCTGQSNDFINAVHAPVFFRTQVNNML